MEFIKSTSIKCDKCGWSTSIEFEQVPYWHNKKCPDCKNTIIIDDSDLIGWNAIAFIAHLQSALGFEDEDEGNYIKIDTSK